MGRTGSVVSHAIVWLVCWLQVYKCSEFPERECCDPIYPLIPDLEPLPPNQPTTTIASSSSSYLAGAGGILSGRSGEFCVKRCEAGTLIKWISAELSRHIKKFHSMRFLPRLQWKTPAASRILNFHFQSQTFLSPLAININGH